MRYIQIQRKHTESFITIGEYIKITDPVIYDRLITFMAIEIIQKIEAWKRLSDITNLVLAAADVYGVDKHYQYIMQERPRPGRGGLLPGEGDDAL
ncbi:hypothetical protein [Thermoanaerobacterium sp. DL9XJH110]|uniref:hypothetical protein n=1 Tax=Thermoanaerobacterium sp. DL9XJH110 TaxID=3386643 RepID=UPI003BB80B7E